MLFEDTQTLQENRTLDSMMDHIVDDFVELVSHSLLAWLCCAMLRSLGADAYAKCLSCRVGACGKCGALPIQFWETSGMLRCDASGLAHLRLPAC